MNTESNEGPDSTAVRVALWRALHLEIDAPPHVLDDDLGLKLVAPQNDWRERPDMHPQGTAPFRASIVARARFIEDFVADQSTKGVHQYVILGAGLDTFAQRKPEIASKFTVFEVEKYQTQEWKRQRLIETGYPPPSWLRFVPVDFEAGESWWTQLIRSGFDEKRPAVLTSIGVSMYLTREAVLGVLRQMAQLARGSTFLMTFLLPLELVDPRDQRGYEMSMNGAQNSGTPFISFFSPAELLKLARQAGFQNVEHQSTASMVPRYFAGRSDGLRPSTGEEILIAQT